MRSVMIQFHQEVSPGDISRFMHKLNIAISNRVHGKVLQYHPPKVTKRLILECPIEAIDLAEALDQLPRELRALVLRMDVFTELITEEQYEQRRAAEG
jgi:hypothetical protein